MLAAYDYTTIQFISLHSAASLLASFLGFKFPAIWNGVEYRVPFPAEKKSQMEIRAHSRFFCLFSGLVCSCAADTQVHRHALNSACESYQMRFLSEKMHLVQNRKLASLARIGQTHQSCRCIEQRVSLSKHRRCCTRSSSPIFTDCDT